MLAADRRGAAFKGQAGAEAPKARRRPHTRSARQRWFTGDVSARTRPRGQCPGAQEVGRPSDCKDLGVVLDADDFELRVEQIDAEDFRTETNLGEVAGLDDPAVHKAVERGLLGVGGLNQRIEYMERHRALAAFRNDDLPLFEEKLGFLARQLDPDAQVERFDRVLDLIDLPDVANDPGTRDVDIARLLEILESEEAREFRSWLRGLDSLRDNEVEQEIRKLRDLVRRAVRSSAGKGVRFAATTGVGLIPGAQLAGLGLGALDAFVLERLVPEAGPTAFLSQLYPTVFVS